MLLAKFRIRFSLEVYVRGILPNIRQKIELAKALYNLSHGMIVSMLALPIILVFLYSVFLLIPATRKGAILSLTENHPVEIITFLGLFAGGLLGLVLAWRAGKRREKFLVVGFYTLFSLGLLLISLEEISWGQTFFGFSTPRFILQENIQPLFILRAI